MELNNDEIESIAKSRMLDAVTKWCECQNEISIMLSAVAYDRGSNQKFRFSEENVEIVADSLTTMLNFAKDVRVQEYLAETMDSIVTVREGKVVEDKVVLKHICDSAMHLPEFGSFKYNERVVEGIKDAVAKRVFELMQEMM